MKPLYLYAIVGERPRGSLGAGIGRGKVEVVRAGSVFVVAQRANAPKVTANALRAHDRVVRRIADRVPALLPFRFGSIADDAAAVASLVEPVGSLIEKALDLVRECVQFTLRVHGKPAPKRAVSGGPGTRFLAARLEARRVPEIADLTTATAEWVRASRAERHDRPPLLASVYHLVPREHEAAYRAALERASEALTVRVTATGPFPPYAFSELQ